LNAWETAEPPTSSCIFNPPGIEWEIGLLILPGSHVQIAILAATLLCSQYFVALHRGSYCAEYPIYIFLILICTTYHEVYLVDNPQGLEILAFILCLERPGPSMRGVRPLLRGLGF